MTADQKPVGFGIIANNLKDKKLRSGAKVWITMVNGGGERCQVRGLNAQGRMIEKYVAFSNLTSYRPSAIMSTHKHQVWPFGGPDDRAVVQTYCDALNSRADRKEGTQGADNGIQVQEHQDLR